MGIYLGYRKKCKGAIRMDYKRQVDEIANYFKVNEKSLDNFKIE